MISKAIKYYYLILQSVEAAAKRKEVITNDSWMSTINITLKHNKFLQMKEWICCAQICSHSIFNSIKTQLIQIFCKITPHPIINKINRIVIITVVIQTDRQAKHLLLSILSMLSTITLVVLDANLNLSFPTLLSKMDNRCWLEESIVRT